MMNIKKKYSRNGVVYFHSLITPSRLLDTSVGCFGVLHSNKSVITSLWPGAGISGPDRGGCSSVLRTVFDVFDELLVVDVFVCTS